ncbi:MAG: Fe-Mn family superoxide dismutase [Candidatus Pacebacteria bacterium]|nr:Fe-Mn family superoxide dismutase [Candidatus Paceibacterota bacterium]
MRIHRYKPQTFDLPTLNGISDKQIEVHLELYKGYVKHVNHIREQIKDLTETDSAKYAYAIAELRRRLGFEFNGMRMHEYYFTQLEGGAQAVDPDAALVQALTEKYGSFEGFIEHFTTVGMTRGVGWVILYADPKGGTVHTAWISEHELGQLGSLPVLLAIDMWEHAFMVDYLPAEKKQYIDAFLNNVNWETVAKRFECCES